MKLTLLLVIVVAVLLLLAVFNFLHLGHLWPLLVIVIGAFIYPILKSEISLPVVNALFPVVAAQIQAERQFRQNLAEATRLVGVLESYGVWKFESDLAERLAKKVPSEQPDVLAHCIEQIVKQHGHQTAELSAEHVRFLYEASTNTVQPELWNMRKQSVANGLAIFLLRSKRLKKTPADLELAAQDLERLMLQSEANFHLDLVNELVTKLRCERAS